MKKLILACILVFLAKAVSAQDYPMPTEADYPEISAEGKSIADFIPKGWEKLSEAAGDLNGDKISDAALVVKGNSPKFLTINETIPEGKFDTNPRMLIILFAVKDGYRLAETNNKVIAFASSPSMTEPFQSIKISNRVLQIEQEIFMSAGGWTTSKHIYKFRYQNNDFVLIGADYQSLRRNSGEIEKRSYNFMTRQVQIKTGNIESDKDKISRRAFKVGKSVTLKTFPAVFEYEVEKDFFL